MLAAVSRRLQRSYGRQGPPSAPALPPQCHHGSNRSNEVRHGAHERVVDRELEMDQHGGAPQPHASAAAFQWALRPRRSAGVPIRGSRSDLAGLRPQARCKIAHRGRLVVASSRLRGRWRAMAAAVLGSDRRHAPPASEDILRRPSRAPLGREPIEQLRPGSLALVQRRWNSERCAQGAEAIDGDVDLREPFALPCGLVKRGVTGPHHVYLECAQAVHRHASNRVRASDHPIVESCLPGCLLFRTRLVGRRFDKPTPESYAVIDGHGQRGGRWPQL